MKSVPCFGSPRLPNETPGEQRSHQSAHVLNQWER
jgi:hypothetical protein